ncbi:MAG TPA: MFS transporter, partial [Solirubrobacteraceae bacterium]|nr:MFS transporter [Solirubrobacteraceae bacterium]
YAEASALVLAATISSSIIQPLFGVLSDRRPASWLLPSGILLAGAGVSVAGLTQSYGLTFAAIVASGVGVAAYHPEASRFANYVSGPRRATGMSLFAVGGNAGFALGPVVATPLVLAFGLGGTIWILVPALAMTAALLLAGPRLRGFRSHAARRIAASAGHDEWGAFARLVTVITLRSWAFFGLVTFVPLYFTGVLGTSTGAGNAALTAMLAGGAVGTLIGGPLADRFGRRPVLIGSLLSVAPAIGLFLLAGPVVGTILLALVGALTICTFAVTTVMGQELLPRRIGLASGVTLGLSIGAGGIGAALLGVLADAAGLTAALGVAAVLPLIGAAVAWTVRPRARSAGASAPGLAAAR